MLNYQLEIVGEEFVTSIGHSGEIYFSTAFLSTNVHTYGLVLSIFGQYICYILLDLTMKKGRHFILYAQS